MANVSVSNATSPESDPNPYTTYVISASNYSDNTSSSGRSELDSHANMVLLGKDAYVFDGVQDRSCTVQPFDPSLGLAKKVPIVDGAIAYDCPYSMKTFIFIFKNALYVPSLDHNLIPPFILREAGLYINEVAKIHSNDPTVNHHSIRIDELDLRVPLKLNGVFSYFESRKPTHDELLSCDNAFLTPDTASWNPYSEHFAENEESMLDWEGNIIESRFRKKVKEDDDLYVNSSSIASEIYESTIDGIIASVQTLQIDETLESTAQTDAEDFALLLEDKVQVSNMASSIGATTVSMEADNLYVFDVEAELQAALADYDDDLIDNPVVSAIASEPERLNAEFLSKVWQIKHDEAEQALNQTTQLHRHGADNALSRQFSTNDRMLRYRRIDSVFFTDTLFVTGSAKSTRGYTCAQLFVSDKGFVAIYPMSKRSSFKDALKLFCKEVGVPLSLVLDPSGEARNKDVKSFCHKVGATLKLLQESTQWANRAELYIGIFKEAVRQDLRRSNAPLVLWDYCMERRAKIHNLTPKSLFQLNSLNPHTATFGTQGDISNLLFDWYEWCYFREESNNQFPYQKEVLGRVLGPMKNEGNLMTQAVLKSNGLVVPRRTCRRLTVSELHSPTEQKKRELFDDLIRKKLGDSVTVTTSQKPEDSPDIADFQLDEGEEPPTFDDEDPVTADGKAVYDQPFSDLLLNAEVILPQGEEFKSAKVVGRSKDSNGDIIGEYNSNPLLNSLVYDVEFNDGTVRSYGANVIAQNMYQQLDNDGHAHFTLDCIVDHHVDYNDAVRKEDRYIHTKSNQRRLRHTTAGWKLLARWKNGEEQWVPLKILKEANPVECAEYAKARGISDEAAFAWWVPYTLRKRDTIISAVHARVKQATHKYGIEVPTSIEHAKKIDELNGNTFWQDAIAKEMANVKVAFEILRKGEVSPPGWTKSSGHLVFDVKMDFTRKARWVKDGHRTPDPEQSTFAGVVSRESVRIALTYAALNDINVTAADIKNAYLQAPSSEKHYVICGPEFGLENVGKVALIRRALYGGKSSGADFWRHLRTCMEHLGFTPCKADGEIWMRPATKPSGEKYWEYVLLYVDDALCISMNGERVLEDEIGKYFYIKEGSVGPPDIYLGNKVSQVTLENGVKAWSWSSSQYVQAACSNVEKYIHRKGKHLPKVSSPWLNDYRPELDVSPELKPPEAAHYQSLIGILRWIVELGRADITAEASLMASCLALPREGHLEIVYRIFAYLKAKHNAEMVFDPSEPEIDESKFERENWDSSVYNGAKESIPKDAPEVRGFGFKIRAFVDSDHAGDEKTRRSRTGYMVFLNNAPIYWTSKKQGSIMTSSFGSEFIAMKECCEYLRGLRYKLRMMGIPCDYPSYIYGDNQSVLVNSSTPTSTLKKKSCSIAYHFVREGTAADEWRMTYISTHDNVADLLTKPLRGGEKRTKFVKMFLHHI